MQATIQGALESAILHVCGSSVTVAGAGRTDSGAHACGQVVSFVVDTALDDGRLLMGINAHLPPDIAFQELSTVDSAFDPRRHATSREYQYLVLNRPTSSPLWRGRAYHVRHPLNLRPMRDAAAQFVGVHNFRGFPGSSVKTCTVRRLYEFDIFQESDLLRFRIIGSGFVHHMIRSIVGCLVSIGAGQSCPEEVGKALRGESDNSSPKWSLAPAHGLYLVNVGYETPDDCSNDIHHARQYAATGGKAIGYWERYGS